MIAIAASRALEGRVANAADGRAATAGEEGKGQDKRACHECRKSLMGLAFSRAWRSVVCRFPEFVLRFQRFGMHRLVPRKGRVFA